MTSIFSRHGGGTPVPRSPAPPSSFPQGLAPSATPNNRRISRTDMDFEQALRAGGTVVLKEGVDVNSLGADASPGPSPRPAEFSPPTPPAKEVRTPQNVQPSTPVVVPPTPSPSAAKDLAPSPSSSSNDLFYDAEDPDMQMKRRSLYRSPGTSSSPDLATLLKKAKERGGVVGGTYKKEKRQEVPPLPDTAVNGLGRPSPAVRPRSSTSSAVHPGSPHPPSYQVTPTGTLKPNWTNDQARNAESPGDDDGWNTRSRKSSKTHPTTKPPKQTVRAKTSAFLGRILGQGTVRERSRADAPLPSMSDTPTPSLFQTFSSQVQGNDLRCTPVPSHVPDVFTSQPLPDTTKPLPPILPRQSSRDSDKSDDRSIVVVEKPLMTPEKTRPPDSSSKMPCHAKKRSMSVGDMELKNTITAVSSNTALPGAQRKEEMMGWDPMLHGIISDFKGELSQLDSTSSSPLDLRDPSTPSRWRPFPRSKTDGLVLSHNQSNQDEHMKSKTYTSAPTLTLDLASDAEELKSDTESRTPRPSTVEAAISPPRTSSLTSSSVSNGSPGLSVSRHGSSRRRSRHSNPFANLPSHGIHGHSSSRDLGRLRVQHRSAASSSEPSLIPASDGVRERPSSIRLVPSSQHVVSSDIVSPTRNLGFQQDLSMGDLSQANGEEETSDMAVRGKDLASRCWAEDEQFLAKEKIAEWLGGQGRINKVALRHYADFFDFSGLRLDVAFRRLCAKLYLKAETQQVDRILDEFSRRYWDNNAGSLYGSASVVHAVSYSLLLLNTDLHVADLTARMSRSQFVRNTLTAIQMQIQSSRAGQASSVDLPHDDGSSFRGAGSDGTATITSRSKRSGSITSWKSISRDAFTSSPVTTSPSTQASSPNPNSSTVSVQFPTGLEDKTRSSSVSSVVYGRNWENEMENLLKEMYNAIKSQQILQPLGSTLGARNSMSSLSPGGISRNRSLRSQPDRLATLKRGSIRGLHSLMTTQTGTSPYSSNSSIDGRVSPSPSFATSTHEAYAGSSSSFLAPALGFASNLSHTIIRETQEDDDHSIHSHESSSTNISITDEELALLGAPWAKEGMLCRKQYWESTGKRARAKAWTDVFVVIQKGELNMFVFGDHGGGGSSVVGGGNWLENAQPVGTVQLSHSLAHALPPPGYNRQRPHCMVLTLSNGGVYFFQAGTEELVNEWVTTCNYWAARTSKEPLAGGVSNMEYGWNRVTDPYNHGHPLPESEPATRESDSMSVRSSRSVRSKLGFKDGPVTMRSANSPWNDRVSINDWKAPLPPTVSSLHDEETQMEALRKHVSSMKKDLKGHNELREPMTGLYQPRTSNAIKAQSNWEKKSQYLLTEIVKYDSYIDSLQAAMSLRLKKRGEKALERALVVSSPEASDANKKLHDEEPIREGSPNTPPQPSSQFHRRETADGC